MKEVEKYLFNGETKKIFSVYNRAFTISTFSQRAILIDEINQLISNVEIEMLEEVCGLLKFAQENTFNKDLIGCGFPLFGKYGKFGPRTLKRDIQFNYR